MTVQALSPTQAAALLLAAGRTREPIRDRAVVAVCLDGGPHRRELVATRRRDFDAESGLLMLGAGRTRRTVRLGRTAFQAVLAAAQPDPEGPLLASRSGAPLTERMIHEQLLTIGSLAGVGHWVAARHLRRTFLAFGASAYSVPVLLRLAGHGDQRHLPASEQTALEAQLQPGWTSMLDQMLGQAARREAA